VHDTTAFKTLRWVVITLLAAFTLLPLYIMMTSSLKPLADVRGAFTWWPSEITVQPFIDMWTTVPLARYFWNSIVVSLRASSTPIAGTPPGRVVEPAVEPVPKFTLSSPFAPICRLRC
jgi:multiple sugar transport system permease protein